MSAIKLERLEWVFFDLDGTLADSISVLFNLYRNFLVELKVSDHEEDLSGLNGLSLSEIILYIKSKYLLKHSFDDLFSLYKKMLRSSYEQDVKPMEGAAEVLYELKKKYKLQLVTSGDVHEAMAFIKKQNWDPFFENYVFGNEVKKGKPHPEIFDLALSKAKCNPDNAIVVEDSVNGVKASRAAGITTIGFSGTAKGEQLLQAGAAQVVAKLSELPTVLR